MRIGFVVETKEIRKNLSPKQVAIREFIENLYSIDNGWLPMSGMDYIEGVAPIDQDDWIIYYDHPVDPERLRKCFKTTVELISVEALGF